VTLQDFSGLTGVAVVTGGSGGVGRAVCRLLAERGSDVALTYHSRREAADETVTAVRAAGREADAWPVDLTDAQAAADFAQAVLERFGAVHTLVHAAGLHVTQLHISRATPEQYSRHLVGEAAGFFNIVHPLLGALREQKGSIVAVTTVATVAFPIKDGLSASPKGAVEGMVRVLAAEEGKFGVRANSVGPGILADGMAARLIELGESDEQAMQVAMSKIPLRRLGSSEDVAEAVCFMASPAASYITGQKLDIDGGYAL
jgi:NAD(P)-dependent dehydrogenase (short-subunit alcohol dehydrogenase family)